MRIVLDGVYDIIDMQHVGDDVVAGTDNTEVAAFCVQQVMRSGLNMNPSKQAFGTVCAEFLRTSYTSEMAVGYLCRSIANGVAGNWVTLAPLDTREYVEAVANLVWTWRSRGQSTMLPQLWNKTLRRRLNLSVREAKGVCSGSVSLNGSPLWNVLGRATRLDLTGGARTRSTPRRVESVKLPRFAAEDFKAVSREYATLCQVGVSGALLDEVMLEASYGNFATVSTEAVFRWHSRVVYITQAVYRPKGNSLRAYSEDVREPGMLLRAVAPALDERQLTRIGKRLNVDVSELRPSRALKTASFTFGTPYSDARYLQSNHRNCVQHLQIYKVLI
jgi:hypothetical protein